MKRFWVIDDEFASYEAETKILKERHPDCEIHFSKEICDADVKAYADETDALIVQIGVPVDREFLGKFKKSPFTASDTTTSTQKQPVILALPSPMWRAIVRRMWPIM